jgi:hypothetical protein
MHTFLYIKKFLIRKHIFISILILLLSTIFLNSYITSKRLTPYEPDDSYHYLSKAVFLKNCKNEKCFFENLFLKKQEEKANKSNAKIDRQIHRLTQSYHPLYTAALSYLIKDTNNYLKGHRVMNIFLSFLIFLLVFFYVKNFFKNSLITSSILIILSLHFFQGGMGIQFPMPFTISIFLSAISLALLEKHKSISLLFIIFSCLMHKVGILISSISFLTYLINAFFFKNKNSFNLFYKDQIKIIISFTVIIFFCFFAKFNIAENYKTNLINLYSFEYNLFDILESIKNNFKSFIIMAGKTILYLNPIFLYFFLASLRNNYNNQFRVLKIFTLLIISFMIFFPYGIKFAFGMRSWPLMVCNYLIIGFYGINELKKNKYNEFIKKIYLFTMPFFIILNLYSLYNYSLYKVYKNDLYYDSIEASKFSKKFVKEYQVIFNSSEETFYSNLIAGYVHNNFYYKSPEKLDSNYIMVVDNPVNFSGSSIILKNNTEFLLSHKFYGLIVNSVKSQTIKINGDIHQLHKGNNTLTNIKIDKIDKDSGSLIIEFSNIHKDLRLLGIMLDKNQVNFWPWGEDVSLIVGNIDFNLKRPFIFSKRERFRKIFNFKTLNSDILSMIKSNCLKRIIYDKDSSLIINNNCRNTRKFDINKIKISQVFALNFFKGNLYAASTFHNRIVKLDENINYLQFMNFYGNFEDLPKKIDNEDIFTNNHTIIGQMINVHGIEFDNEENNYISQYLSEDVNNLGLVFAPKSCHGTCSSDDLKFIGGFKGVSHAYLDIKKQNILVADYGAGDELEGDIFKINLSNLKSREKISKISGYKFKKPHMIRNHNEIYYAIDTGNSEIVMLDKNYKVLKIINNTFLMKKNKADQLFKTLAGISFSKEFIFVTDVGNHSIMAFDHYWNLKFMIKNNIYHSYELDKISMKNINKYEYNYYIKEFSLKSPFDLLYNNKTLYIANTHENEIISIKF